ncbi:helix-turn-helix domain-containing protein [Hyphomicrobium nitrativorans]|uniref:helix-turn-helix domain-containing protein n=1 Tax=Hyphomicrobium nitrativorans TaxID=1427356 RepID=UPI0009DEEFDE
MWRLKMENVCLTPDKAGRLLNRTPKTLKRWRDKGVGPKFLAVHGRYLYPVAELREWMAANTFGSSAELNRAA